jgi:lipooligosaccharide transport system ATP-binding protein
VRQELWALIDGLRSDGVSILMSTHYIEEAERLCDTVTIMSKGRAVAIGEPSALVEEHAGANAWEVFGPPAMLEDVERRAKDAERPTRRTGTSITVLGGDSPLPGFEEQTVRRTSNLEDVFVLLTGEEIG